MLAVSLFSFIVCAPEQTCFFLNDQDASHRASLKPMGSDKLAPLVLDDAQRSLRASVDRVARPPAQIGFVGAYRAKDFSPADVIARLKYFGSSEIALPVTDTDFEIHFDFHNGLPRKPPYPIPPAAWLSDNLSSKGLNFFRNFAFLFQIHAIDCLGN